MVRFDPRDVCTGESSWIVTVNGADCVFTETDIITTHNDSNYRCYYT